MAPATSPRLASARRVGEQHDRAERIAVEDRLAAAARDLVARAAVAAREDDLDPRQVERVPVDDRRAGDEGAVVERVGELGERAETARQARVDDLDGDAQRRDRSADFLARIGARRPRRQVARELEGEFALELGRDEAGYAQDRQRGPRVVHPRREERAGDRHRHAERLALRRRHRRDLPAAGRAELARHCLLQPVRLGQVARDAGRGPGRDRACVAACAGELAAREVEVDVFHRAIVAVGPRWLPDAIGDRPDNRSLKRSDGTL